ncbi:MAG: lipid A deacylase LpxR family protein [Rhodospirillales bacterium]|nr:lipid A deacylase LpxR family protein [Rhodospirillales bacterium]
MRSVSLIAGLVVLTMAFPAIGQERPTMQEEATQLIRKSTHKNFMTLAVENDSIGKGTDQNYTSGVRATYFNVNARIPQVIDDIAAYIPTFDISETTSIAYSIGQNLYTPDDIKSPQQDPNDRPWAAWLYGSAGLATLTGNHIDELELTLGMVGPAAQGEFAQKYIHSLIGSPDPKGWDNQLKNEPGVIASWLRRWPQAAYFENAGLFGALEPNVNISLGNIYTYAGTGLTFTLSPASDRWQDTPQRVRPAIPGTGYFQIPDDGWGWQIFAGVDGRAVAHNIFLDGNMFADSHSIDKEHFVADFNTGFALTFERVRLSYTLTYRTKEFERQDDNDLFGGLTLSYRY